MKTTSSLLVLSSLRFKTIMLVTLAFIFIQQEANATTRTSVATGNWSAASTWSPAGEPASSDIVIIHGGNVVTVDSIFTCSNLTIGDATATNTTVQITTSGNALTITGALSINPGNVNKTYTLNAGPGAINISGTFPTWGTTGTNTIEVGTGTLSFTPAVSITSANQNITFTTTAGTVNFNSSFTDSYNKLAVNTNATVNFGGSYTVNTTAASWNGKGTAIFANTGTITATSNLTLNNVQTANSASATLASAAGIVVIAGAITLGSGSTLTAGENFEADGNWANNGGTFSCGTNTLTFNGTTTVTGATAFTNLQIGNTATSITASVTLDNSISCTSLTLNGYTRARTVTVSGGDTLIVNGNVIINQPTAAVTNTLAVNTGTCIITGNVTFTGTNTTASYISKIAVTTGLLNIEGTVSYDANTVAANEVITVTSTGVITMGSAINLAYGTLSATSTGTINFNGAAPSFTFGSSNSPVFTTTNGCTVNFADGFVNNTNAYTFAANSNSIFTAYGTIKANAAITFGNLQFNGSDTLASTGNLVEIAGDCTLGSGSTFNALQSFELLGSWTNNGGTMAGTNDTIMLIGSGEIISGTAATTFQAIQLGNSSSPAVSYTMNNNNSCTGMIFYGGAVANTLTLGTGYTLTVNGNLTNNQPTAAVTNNLLINGGVCSITGSLNLPGTNDTATHLAKITVTSGALTVSGSVNWGVNTTAGAEVITVTTGSITFNSSMTMASGTLSVTSTGTISFNGNSPSFTYGGSNSPVFTTTSGCNINFEHGFTNNTNAVTLIAGSNTYFTGSGTITPNATITFGNAQIDSLHNDTLNTATGLGIVAGSFTLLHGSNITASQPLEVRGAWVNNGGTISPANTIMMNGVGQTIGGSSSTIFPILQMGDTSVAVTVTCTVNANITVDSLVFNGYTNARTLTLSSGITLTVSGNVNINQPGGTVTNTLAVSSGTCNVSGNLNFIGTTNTASHVAKVSVTSGTFSLSGNVSWMANTLTATEVITVATGTINFASSLTMGTGSGTLSVTGAGTVNFNGTTAPSFNFGGGATSPSFTTFAGCTLNFENGFTNNSIALTIKAGSNTYFTGSGSITPNAAITFGNVQINSSFNDTLNSAAGAVIIAGNFTLAPGSTFFAKENFEVRGNWTNTSGTLSGTTFTVFLNGTAQILSGSPTTFQTLEIGNTTVSVVVAATMANNNTCSALIFQASSKGRALTLNSGNVLTVTGNLTMNQPSGNSMTNLLEIGAGTCIVSGNLVFSGANATATRVAKLDVTTGTFNLTGTVTWGGGTSTAINVISLNSGTINFSSSVAMGTKSGTINVTGAGIINFNGASAPSLTFGGAVAPVLTSVSGSTLNFKNGFATTTTALILSPGSIVVFTGTGSLSPAAALTVGNIKISPSVTLTMGGSISVTNNWIDSGTVTPGIYGVTLNGSGTQTINRSGGTETFYQLTTTSSGAIAELLNNVTVTNALTMNGANINLNAFTLTLGNSAGAALTYVGGIAYGGTWKRWLPATAISSTSGSYYGLFPIGTSTDYRYVTLNTTVNPTTAGYVSASHTDATGGTIESYTDNGGSLIEEIANMHSDLSTTTLAGGIYNIAVHFTGFSPTGNVSDLKLETHTGGVMGSVGTHLATVGAVSSPTLQRDTITASQISNTWVAGTNNKYATPLYSYYFSRKTGNWSDTSAWSFTSGGSGPSCGCTPISNSYVVIDSANTVTVNTSDSVQYIDILNDGTLAVGGSNTFIVTANMSLYNAGTFTNNGTMVITGALILPPGNSPSSSGNVTVGDETYIPNGGSYSQTGGTLTLNSDLVDSGTITVGPAGAINLNGLSSVISGVATINDSLGIIIITNHKTITTGTILTLGKSTANTTVGLTAATTVNNEGYVTLNGSITGASGTSSWINNSQSALNITGNVLTTGVFDPSTGPNTVNYNGSGSQTINSPATSYYNLTISNNGSKTLKSAVEIDNALTISDSAILNDSTSVFSGSGAINMTSNSQLLMQRSVVGVYPELTGIYSLTAGTVTLNQTGDSAVLATGQYYNLTLNGTVANDISGLDGITNNFNIQSAATLNNDIAMAIGGTFTYASSGYTTLQDDITTNGLALNSGTLDDGGNNITINGSIGWNGNGGTYNSSGGQVIFYNTGGTAQTIGGSAATTFNNLIIDNPSGVTLNVSPAAPTVVYNNISLTSGNLITSATNILRMLDTASVSNASDTSYVSGPMVKVGNTNFIFPVGKGGKMGQAAIAGGQSLTTEVTAEYFNTSYSTIVPAALPLTQVDPGEYWNITRAITSDSLQIQLFWTNAIASGIVNLSYLTVAEYTGTKWIDVPASPVSGSVGTGSGSGSVLTINDVSSFGPFTFGSSGGTALPIELVSFSAVPQGNEVITNWVTDVEINNAYFTVERSADAINFAEVGQVEGAGNSVEQHNYQLPDQNPLPGVSYYRLRQTDFNGQFKYSNLVEVEMQQSTSVISIYPNPAHGPVLVNIPNPSGQISLKVFEEAGREVYSKNINADGNADGQTLTIPSGSLQPGIYLVSIYTGNATSVKKLVMQ